MWNDQSRTDGGFFNSQNEFGNVTNTPNQRQKSARRASRTAPIVIKQALNCGDEGVKIWGTEIQIVSIVARVQNIREQSTKITYTIQDITGRMKAVLWLEQESMDENDQSTPKVNVNDYIQIYGNVKTNKGRKVLMAFKIMPVTDVNAITFHYLQCLNNKLKLQPGMKKDVEPINNSSMMGGLPANSMVGMNDNMSFNGLNARQVMVYKLISSAASDQGISKQDLLSNLRDRMTEVELENILEFMCNEGHIYSTIDEEHFRAT
ncbi:unnamed protein product [Danaus chrysippus]|uniref:(African queen) hypothetical protein n=1 Tax=Danaus chrysippus TaxID=151541 RepID=A0A8J2QLA8_9NEOP|nr:unnamed protein product [Danaus chrysippus]